MSDNKNIKNIEIIIEETWDDHSFLVGETIDDLQMVAGTDVMRLSDFKKAVKEIIEKLNPKINNSK